MAKGIEIKFKNNIEAYDVFTSNVLNGLYIKYLTNFTGDKLVITGNTVDFSTDYLFIKLKSKKSERKLVINLKKVLAPSVTPTPLVSSTPTKTVPIVSTSIGVTPTSTTPQTSTTIIPPTPSVQTPPVDASGLYTYSGFVYTSYVQFTGNDGSVLYFEDIKDLYNNIMTDSSTYANIIETIKTNNSGGIVVGSKIYNENNAQFTNTDDFYMGYFDNGNPKYIKIVNNVVSEIGDLVVQTTSVTGTKILFPYYMTINGKSGWGYANSTAEWFENYLNIASDGLTIISSFKNGNYDSSINNTNTFKITLTLDIVNPANKVTERSTAEYTCTPYFTINRGEKIKGLMNGYKIPDMYRGTLIELTQSVTATSNRLNNESEEMNNLRNDYAATQLTSSYHVLVGK